MKLNRLGLFATLATLTAAFSVSLALGQTDPTADAIQAQAKVIFAQSDAGMNLPPHLVRQLSIAVAFHNYDGAAKLIRRIQLGQ